MIKVLIVDDSASTRLFLERVFSSDPDIRVVGTAKNGEEAVAAVARLAPDVITMDIFMPRMNGLEATRRIMESHPTPIIILSGDLDQQEILTSFQAMEAGALVALPKPRGAGHPDHEQEVRSLVQKTKLMAEVKVVRRWPRRRQSGVSPRLPDVTGGVALPEVVAIGASTGGPVVVKTILEGLGDDFPLPVLIVQHMAEGFTPGLVGWLALSSRLPVHLATQGETLLPGHAYVAPDGCHMLTESGGRIRLSSEPPDNGLRPSVASLFRSVADVYGKTAVGVILTGMGRDGVDELLLLKEKGAVTIAQDKASSVIYGMPGEAVRAGAATYELSSEKIAAMLVHLAKNPASTVPVGMK